MSGDENERLSAALPVEYSLGVRCTVGVKFTVPVLIQALNISALDLASSVTGQSIVLISDELHYRLPEGDESIVAEMVFLPLRPTVGKEWITINVHGGRLHQAVTFAAEVWE